MADEKKPEMGEVVDAIENEAEEKEGYVMLSDVIKEQEELEDRSIAVYGASDDKFCSYDNVSFTFFANHYSNMFFHFQGYLKRQALFSCLTCNPKTTEDLSNAAGICLACSYKCHENHKLIELYTKRNFRCDCGTNKMPDSKCNLTKTKEGKLPINRDNIYNHNFQGLYCTCNRPYPDPENDDEDIMAQCNICEDWFHYCHLNTSIPENADVYDLICEKCVKDNEFLQYYHKYSTQVAEKIASESDDKLRSDLDRSISDILNIDVEEAENPPASKKPRLEGDPKKEEPTTSNGDCTLPTDKAGYVDGAMFLPSTWRDTICKCDKCKEMYEDKKVMFLLDPEDCQRSYEEKGIEKTEHALESTLENLSATNRVALVETIHEFHNMAGKLKEFLAPFMGSEKVVTQDDINRFFEEMKNNRSKSSTAPSTFCR